MQCENDCKRVVVTNSLAIAVGAVAILLLLFAVPSTQAQTYTVMHNFAAGLDGYGPIMGLIQDRAGNYYGAAGTGGTGFGGVVFKLTLHGSAWIFTPLHEFSFQEGSGPNGLTFGPDGNLYGTAAAAGAGGVCTGSGCGTVFKLSPPPSNCRTSYCPWNLTVLYRFSGGADGGNPAGGVVFDQAGNLYGTTTIGGLTNSSCIEGCGVAFKLTPSPQGAWTQSVIHSFGSGNDGQLPYSSLLIDSAGNLYGTTAYGGGATCLYQSCGTIYELTPSGQAWTETILYNFANREQGSNPFGGLISDAAGNLYGTAAQGANFRDCSYGCGTVFSLSPSNGGWVYTMLYAFTGLYADEGPRTSLLMDAAGNLYGTTFGSDNPVIWGNIFELSRANGSWSYTSLHTFTGGADGGLPLSNVLQDANGNLYGTASKGGYSPSCDDGQPYCGVIWEVTP